MAEKQTAMPLEYIGKFISHTAEVIRNELRGHWSDSDRYLELKNSACMIVFQWPSLPFRSNPAFLYDSFLTFVNLCVPYFFPLLFILYYTKLVC